jgi:hypothetical protein
MPPTLRTQVDQRMPDEAAIGQQRALGGSQEGNDAVEQRADHLPLALFPGFVDRQDLPAHRQKAGMDQQPEIQHGRTLVQRRRIQHEDQAALAPEREKLAQQVSPQREHGDLLVRQKARQASFAAGRLGRADADEGLRDLGQARAPGQDHTQDIEGQRFTPMSMHLRQEGPQLTRPLAPQLL